VCEIFNRKELEDNSLKTYEGGCCHHAWTARPLMERTGRPEQKRVSQGEEAEFQPITKQRTSHLVKGRGEGAPIPEKKVLGEG